MSFFSSKTLAYPALLIHGFLNSPVLMPSLAWVGPASGHPETRSAPYRSLGPGVRSEQGLCLLLASRGNSSGDPPRAGLARSWHTHLPEGGPWGLAPSCTAPTLSMSPPARSESGLSRALRGLWPFVCSAAWAWLELPSPASSPKCKAWPSPPQELKSE